MSTQTQTAEQTTPAAEAPTVGRLWIDVSQGHVTCDAHAGHYLSDAIKRDKAGRRRRVTTNITTWESIRTDDALDPITRANACETCGATVGADPWHAVRALVVDAQKRAQAAHKAGTLTPAQGVTLQVAVNAFMKSRIGEARDAAQTLLDALPAAS